MADCSKQDENEALPCSIWERIGRTGVFLLASAMSFFLAFFVPAIMQSRHVGPTRIMVVLFADLTAAVGAFLVLGAVRIWSPRLRIWDLIEHHAGRHVAAIGVLTFLFVCALIASGILYALGVI